MMDQANRLRSLMETKSTGYELKNRLITVTSGKGGVGKSNFTLNLGLQLTILGQRVVIIDADFGMANIDVLFGAIPQRNFLNMLNDGLSIEEVLVEGPLGIKFISGGSGLQELASVDQRQLKRMLDSFVYLDTIADFILIDTGAGASPQVINLVSAAKETIIVTTPEPTSLTDAYALIKIIKSSTKARPELSLVVNRVESNKEGEDVYMKLNRASHRFLGLELKLLGYVPNDNMLVKAVKAQQPVSLMHPESPSAKSMGKIARELIYKENAISQIEEPSAKGFMSRLVGIFKS